MKNNKIWFWVLAEDTDGFGIIRIYSRIFVTLEEAEEAYNIQASAKRCVRLYKRGFRSSGYGFREVLKSNY